MKKLFLLLTLINIYLIYSLIYTTDVQATKMLPSNYSTPGYSMNMIQQAEDSISVGEDKLDEIKSKAIPIPNEGEVVGKLELAKEELQKAKQYYEEQNYYQASSHGTISKTNADLAIFYFDVALENRITPEGIRLEAEERIISGNEEEVANEIKEGETDIETKEFVISPKENKKAVLIRSKSNIVTLKIVSPLKEVIAKTESGLELKEDKIYLNKKEVKIMPDTASEKAIQMLGLKKDVEIELKDVGKPMYEISGKKEVKILRLIRVNMLVKAKLNAENGELEEIDKPWWSFLVKEY